MEIETMSSTITTIETRAETTFTFDGDSERADVYVAEMFVNAYDDVRAVLKGDTYAAKDAIKFDWETTHHKFDGSRKVWIVDGDDDSLDALAESLDDAGFTFEAEHRDGPAGPLADLIEFTGEGDHVTVEYEHKSSGDRKEKTGTVYAVSDGTDGRSPGVSFTRDSDDHAMFVRVGDDGSPGLYTSGSAYPYQGAPVSVTVAPAVTPAIVPIEDADAEYEYGGWTWEARAAAIDGVDMAEHEA